MENKKMYKWVASSDNGFYKSESNGFFYDKTSAYNDMWKVALERMRWKNEYSNGPIVNNIEFYEDKIVNGSVNGTYTYKVVEADIIECLLPPFKECDKLVGKRFSYETLEDYLNKLFHVNGYIQKDDEIVQINMDYQMTYIIDIEHCFDIYFLKMRAKDDYNKNDIYITEIGNEIY